MTLYSSYNYICKCLDILCMVGWKFIGIITHCMYLWQVPDSCATVAATLHAQLSSEEVDEGVARTEKMNQSSIQ